MLSKALEKRFGTKVYKIALSCATTCPNRDGTAGIGGCIFCSMQGSGEFAAHGASVTKQIEQAKQRVSAKLKSSQNPLYIAYFQAFSSTYAPIAQLKTLFWEAIQDPEVAILSIATRPDCLSSEVLHLLAELNAYKPVWVELGLQTVHEQTANIINRGYRLCVFEKAIFDLKQIGCEVIVHMIVGLPGETKDMAVQTAQYIGLSGADGIKIHSLFVSENTKLAQMYHAGAYEPLTLEEYTDILFECLRVLPKEMIVHRITGDGDKKTLIAPLWTADKKRTLQFIYEQAERTHLLQGENCP